MSRTDATPAADEVDDATAGEERAPWWASLATGSSLWIGLILVGLVVAFSVLEPSTFLSVDNGRNISTDAAILLVLAVGQTFVIMTAGIDLAVGSTLVFAGVISAKMMHTTGGDNAGTVVVGLISGLVAGGAWGLLNGFLVAKAKITPLIVTLGTFGMALGAALVITKGIDEREIPYKLIDGIGTGRVFGQVPWLVVIALGVALGFGILLAQTRFGRYTLAIGSNPEAARRSGVNVDRHLMKVYTLAGVLAGLAGFLSLARFGTTTIGGHSTDNLQSITAVVIGGTSLFGGIGSILGTVFGVFIPAVLQNGFVITGVQPFWQQIAVGAVLVAAVYLDQLRRGRNR